MTAEYLYLFSTVLKSIQALLYKPYVVRCWSFLDPMKWRLWTTTQSNCWVQTKSYHRSLCLCKTEGDTLTYYDFWSTYKTTARTAYLILFRLGSLHSSSHFKKETLRKWWQASNSLAIWGFSLHLSVSVHIYSP